MVVLDGNFALGRGHGTDYPQIHIFQCMLERTDAITNGVLEPITFVLAYPTVYIYIYIYMCIQWGVCIYINIYIYIYIYTHTHFDC
jgi:hypothetical protein